MTAIHDEFYGFTDLEDLTPRLDRETLNRIGQGLRSYFLAPEVLPDRLEQLMLRLKARHG